MTFEDQKLWKIPPCVSNYKNQKSFLIPLEMRLDMEKRNRGDTKINDKFKNFADALSQSEKRAKQYLKNKRQL